MSSRAAPLLFLALLALLGLLSAATDARGERIGLVLGGGGARGAAHVGVLKVLEEQGIAVDFVVGTSMGAIVGALYASGYRAADIEVILAEIDWAIALRDQPDRQLLSPQRKADASLIPSSLEVGVGPQGLRTPQGLIQGQNLGLLLRRLLSHVADTPDFDRLPIPFRAVAADVVTGEAVILGSGDLVDAVRASMSVPGAFQPIRIDDRLLVDGGVVDNVPIDVARAIGAERLIAVDVGAGLASEESLASPVSVTMQVISILMDRQTRLTLDSLGESDILIRPELGDIGSADFLRATEAVPLGEAAARAKISELQALRASPQRLAAFNERPQPQSGAPRRIDRIEVDRSMSRTAFLVDNRLRDLLGQTADTAYIERRISELYGEAHYERIIYVLNEDAGETVLRVTPIDKSWGPHFLRLGLRLSDNFDGGSAYQLDSLLRLASDIQPGAEWRFGLALGERNEFDVAWRVPYGRLARSYLMPSLGWRALDQPTFDAEQDREVSRLRWSRSRLAIEAGRDWSVATRGYLRIERGQDQLRRQVGLEPRFRRIEQDYGFLAVGGIYDSFDDATFPSRGTRLDARMEFYRSWIGGNSDAVVSRFEWNQAASAGRYIAVAGLRAVSASSQDLTLQALDFLGGLGNLSGYGERQLAGPQLLLGRTFLVRRMGDQSQLFSLPTYLGVSLEAGNVWGRREDIDLDELIYAGSLYLGIDSPLGPIFVGYGRSDSGQQAVYLNFGSLVRPRREF